MQARQVLRWVCWSCVMLLPLLTVFFNQPSARAGDYSILHSFGIFPDGVGVDYGLTLSGSTLYGTTSVGGTSDDGTIFKINTDGTGYAILHSFQDGTVAKDGITPTGMLALSGSTLYGMTINGGTSDDGTIFKINTDGTGYAILRSFGDGTVPNEGLDPLGSLTLSGSTLYGVTTGGGNSGNGTLFRINTDGTGYANLHSFQDGTVVNDGAGPCGGLTLVGSTLYGTTSVGGNSDNGTIFKINTDGTGYAILHSFHDGTVLNDGAGPPGSLTLTGSTLYGVTTGGGNLNNGTLFRINTDGTGYAILHFFQWGNGINNGAYPQGSLTLSGSTLFGTTSSGGNPSGGTVFRINTDGTGYAILRSFNGTVVNDGVYPCGGLTLSGSTLYGTTTYGGANDDGIIFSLITSLTVNGVCGSSNGGNFTSAPSSNLCNSGSVSSVSGSGPWTWTCSGQNGGGNASCSANLSSTGGLWQNAKDLGNGWEWLAWFGYFNTNDSPWVYHEQHGWLYPFGTSTDNIWVYDSAMGAFWWTSATVYPYVYRAGDGAWLYYDVGTSNPRWFYNFKTGQWEKH